MASTGRSHAEQRSSSTPPSSTTTSLPRTFGPKHTGQKSVGRPAAMSNASSCAVSRVKFSPRSELTIRPTETVAVVHVKKARAKLISDKAEKLMEESELPHTSSRDRLRLRLESDRLFTSQLGDEDYVCIGWLSASGNKHTDSSRLAKAMLGRAAGEGGEVLLVLNEGVRTKQYSGVSPGYVSTTSYGQASGSASYWGNQSTYNAYGSGSSQTTYIPPTSYTKTAYLPYAEARLTSLRFAMALRTSVSGPAGRLRSQNRTIKDTGQVTRAPSAGEGP